MDITHRRQNCPHHQPNSKKIKFYNYWVYVTYQNSLWNTIYRYKSSKHKLGAIHNGSFWDLSDKYQKLKYISGFHSIHNSSQGSQISNSTKVVIHSIYYEATFCAIITESPKAAIMHSQHCTKYLRICANFGFNECKKGNVNTNFMYLSQDKVILVS